MKKTIRQLSLFDLVRGETIPTMSTDKDITNHKTVLSVKKTKAGFGIDDKNLVAHADELPGTADDGQWCVVDGVVYMRVAE